MSEATVLPIEPQPLPCVSDSFPTIDGPIAVVNKNLGVKRGLDLPLFKMDQTLTRDTTDGHGASLHFCSSLRPY